MKITCVDFCHPLVSHLSPSAIVEFLLAQMKFYFSNFSKIKRGSSFLKYLVKELFGNVLKMLKSEPEFFHV